MSSISNINGHLVIGKLQIPVRHVTDLLLTRHSLESIMQRLPVSKEEVFECLDAIADHDSIQVNDRLVVVNQSTVEEDILLVTTKISDNINHISLKARAVCITLAAILPENSLL